MNIRDNDLRSSSKFVCARRAVLAVAPLMEESKTGALGGDVDAKTVNGSIRVNLGRMARANGERLD